MADEKHVMTEEVAHAKCLHIAEQRKPCVIATMNDEGQTEMLVAMKGMTNEQCLQMVVALWRFANDNIPPVIKLQLTLSELKDKMSDDSDNLPF